MKEVFSGFLVCLFILACLFSISDAYYIGICAMAGGFWVLFFELVIRCFSYAQRRLPKNRP